MSAKRQARARLVKLARTQLPEPGDPRQFIEQLEGVGADADETLGVLSRITLAHRQLRDLKLEKAFQSGFGWFMARNLILFGVLALIARLFAGMPTVVFEGMLAGGVVYFIIGTTLAPLRLRKQAARRAGILANYARDLGEELERLETGAEPAA